MFEGKTILEILQFGGFTMYILVGCSVISIAVILERLVYFRLRSRIKRSPLMEKIMDSLKKRNLAEAITICEESRTPYGKVVKAGLELKSKDIEKISNAMERQISIEIRDLERHTNILGTLGSNVVYIGLFGTVIGIIRAFQDIAVSAGAGTGIGMVISGIAEALVCTATGILVAVPSVIAYNLLVRRVENITVDMELSASETLDLLRK